MKFPWAVAVAMLVISLSGWAQQNNTYNVKNSTPQRKSATVGRTATPTGDPSKDLRALERQQAKATASAPTTAKNTPGTTALKPVQEKPNHPMNVKGSGEGKIPHKSSGLKNNGGKDPYAGRLRQKHAHQ
jgi:hypothetical protein